MNNLIINGIDYSKFDLEWAECGGVVISIIDNPPTKRMIGKVIGDEFFESKHFFTDEWVSDSQEYRVITRKLNKFRMATPDECATAGIEYIEPPMMWRDIESAPRDVLVLVKTDKSKVGCAIFESKTECEYFGLNPIDGTFIHWMPLPHPPKTQ